MSTKPTAAQKERIVMLVPPKPQLPRCDHPVPPRSWNQNDPRCKNFATVQLDDMKLCRKHAGSVALTMLLRGDFGDSAAARKGHK